MIEADIINLIQKHKFVKNTNSENILNNIWLLINEKNTFSFRITLYHFIFENFNLNETHFVVIDKDNYEQTYSNIQKLIENKVIK